MPQPAPTPDEVRRIAALADPLVRNLEITQCYAELAAAVAARTGEGANWCTYATWASRQAGQTIRGEDMLRHLERRLGERRFLLHPLDTLWRLLLRRGLMRPYTRLGRLTASIHTPFDAVERASAAVARGNLKVFAEIGLAFAQYLGALADAERDDAALGRFLERLRPGEPPEGQRYLRSAFARYTQLQQEQDPARRMQLAVLANLEIGLHEQTRLQPEIRKGLDAAYSTHVDLGRRALAAVFPGSRRWWRGVRSPAAALAGAAAAALERAAARAAREVVTGAYMTLSLPGRVLALGEHLAEPFPEALRDPSDAELRELLSRFEPAPPARDDCAARDWSELPQRMHYLCHLFRAFHLRAELGEPPLTPDQLAAIGRSRT